MLADYYAHTYHDDPKAMEEVEDDDFSVDSVASIIGATGPVEEDWEDLK